jgi:Kef-type K+ transport system membrane component KefB/mannitol/fructose-specific phosphotransferase system IIA component (Ntr-type)
MTTIPHHEFLTLLVAIGTLIGAARLCGEIFIRLRQPPIIGEFVAGILLGPTVLGTLSPALHASLFPAEGAFAIGLDTLTKVAVILFLLVAGLEVDLSIMKREGKSALSVSLLGMVVPFGLGFVAAWYIPLLHDASGGSDRLVYSFFFATALSISALPVIAKILMDLGVFRSDVGMVVVAAAIGNDIAGWIVFGVLLGMIGAGPAEGNALFTVLGLCLFAALLLTVVRRFCDRVLPWLYAHTSWPGGVLGFALCLTFYCAATAEWLGAHGIFGAFLFGVALGDSKHLRSHTRHTLEQFISFIFAPLFFASVGLRVNFITNFDLPLVLLVLALGTVGKLTGCWLGARLSGMGRRESWAVGVALNARGAMEIILGLLALHAGLIGERMFVALVVMALVTSMTSAMGIKFILGLKAPRRFFHYMTAKAFLSKLNSTSHQGAIEELSRHVAALAGLPVEETAESVWRREQIMSTSLGAGVAVPHARIPGIKTPIVGVGISHAGVDFDAADGEPCHVLCLLLIPQDDPDVELGILADIARQFQRPGMVERVIESRTHVEFLAVLKTAEAQAAHA